MHQTKQRLVRTVAIFLFAICAMQSGRAFGAFTIPEKFIGETTATISFQQNAPLSITVGELYPSATGAVSTGSTSAEMSWFEPYDDERSLDQDIDYYDSSIKNRSVIDLWHTSAFRTTDRREPSYTAKYSINGSPYSEKAQTVDIFNTMGTSKMTITFTPPAINVIQSRYRNIYTLQAATAIISFSVK